MSEIQFLEWDSDLLNLRVGRLNVRNKANLSMLNKVDNFDLNYIFSEFPIDQEYISLMRLKHVDTKVIYEKNLIEQTRNQDKVLSVYENSKELQALAFRSGLYSRFRLDGNFEKDVFERLYKLWLKNSLNRLIADEVFVQDLKEINGFITVASKENKAVIGLIAVNEHKAGKGIGRKLMGQVEHFAHLNNLEKVRVATQEGNIGAVRFYESLGYHEVEKYYIYHQWNK